jgi:hypothetical protein
MVGKTKQFLSHVVPGVIKPLRVLWNEMIGFIFLCLAVIPLPGAYRAFQQGETFRLCLTLFFCAIMLYFGLSSFFRAKKIQRS